MDRRTTKRIPVNFEADVIWNNKISKAFIVGISENGLYLITDSKDLIDNATALIIKFTVPGEVLALSCEVAWTDKRAGYSLREMGLKIINPPPEFRKLYKSSYYKIKTEISHDAIAVIGMSCYYPGAADLKSFWENILARKRAFRRIPEQRLPLSEYYDPDPSVSDKTYGDRAAVIDGFEFDWVKRGIPKTVVDSSDIVHWLALEVALRALEDAGLTRQSIPSDRSGVILGNTMTGEQSRSQQMRLRWPYVKKVFTSTATQKGLPTAVIDELLGSMEMQYKSAFAPITEDTLAGNLSNTIAGRICNFLDMHGGGYTVDGACSSSLIAVATAANALSAGTLDLAVAGGIDISLDTFELIGFAKTNALTREDMKVYDRRASGFIPGEGAGFVILKRLQDARAAGDYIYAVLRGWGVSSDGKGGMTAPKALTQALAIRRAYGKAGYGLDSVDFIEGHGTGTTAGDKAELEGIASAMEGSNPSLLRPLGITSLKSLIGHTKAASGIGGFIKAVMAVNRRVIPPTAGCSEPNPIFNENARGIYPVIEGEVRDADAIIRAGVSGMGFGGINCHVTVESAGEPAEQIRPSIGEKELLASYQETELFVLSTGTQREMLDRISQLKVVAAGISTGEMVELSKELTHELSADKHFRVALVAGDPGALVECFGRAEQMLTAGDIPKGGTTFDPHQDIWVGNTVSRARLGFLFPGQGSQQLNMGRIITERYGWARELRKKAEMRLAEKGYENIYEHICRPVDRAIDNSQLDGWRQSLSHSDIAQPAICMTSLLWIRHMENLGIRPVVAAGHSLGELTAFYAADVFDDETLLDFAAFRGRATSASEDNAGTMASFACDREKTEELLRDVVGYITIANINSPAQTVVSGERPAVEEAVKRASLANVKTRYLPVSNAFHSRLMAGSADKLFRYAPIPDVLAGTNIKLLTSMDGSEVKPGTDTRLHFSKQVTHPVDFISLINNIRRDCDLLVEVGPGRVLSDLANSIAGTDEPACLPVESKAGDTRSLNVFLGCYFVRGGEVNWTALFENRLVRPFVPASKRFFIENQCERSSVPAEEETLMSSVVIRESGPTVVPSIFPDDAAGLFTRQQIDYIRGLIQAEAQGSVLKDVPAAATGKTDGPLHGKPLAPQNAAAPELLLKLASEMTGFPVDSISMEHRLLDDLNLDSIKAGQFAVRALRLYNAEGKQIDPTAMANSSMREIYDRIKSVIDTPVETREVQPQETVTINKSDNWVRNFKVSYEERPRPSSQSFKTILEKTAGKKRHVLLVSADETDGLASEMENILIRNNIAASSIDYGSLYNLAADYYAKYQSFIFLLPSGKKGAGPLTCESVTSMVSRLSCIGKVITSMKTVTKPEYAVLQFGSGGFYKCGSGVSMEAKGSAAFLCSVYLENIKERIRVLEFHETGDAARILQEVLQELHAGEEFAVASFDRGFKRHVPMLEVSDPRNYRERKTRWTGEDVVLVTGGARGITAECALAFAKRYRVKLAIAGSTVLIHKDEEIENALERYREGGTVFRYYPCDVTDKMAVIELKKQVEKDLGKITGVIHGAALNRPRRLKQIDPGAALKEIAPKLMGAINICDSLKDDPIKLFVGFGSIIGVTGMAGNAWYGFSNEMLSLLLQQFGSDTGAEVITVAFSVWDEIGMGARMGSLDFLSKMGILPIPREKGIERFMQLMEKETGEKQIMVSGRLGGLNTIPRPQVSKPRSSRFLEEVLHYEKGIEIETKVSLTLDSDPYLKDHVFRGSYLFPTVFGIEAMAQAVSAVTGIHDISYLQVENTQLTLPIAVEADDQTEIHIRALVEEAYSADETIRVKAGITVDQTEFLKNHFEATFVLNKRKEAEQYAGKLPETRLDIMPAEDLYGHMLFQGSMFQRIKSVRSLDDRECVFDSETAPSRSFVTADPFFRDTLLQSVQIILPDLIALPVEIEKWEILPQRSGKGIHRVVLDLLQRDDETVTATVTAVDSENRAIEKLHGYKVKIIERVKGAPRPGDLKDPDNWDEFHLDKLLQYYSQKTGKIVPAVSVMHMTGLHGMEKTKRHAEEKKLFGKVLRKLNGAGENLPGEASIAWTQKGKPFVEGSVSVGLSFSHDDRICLCAAGRGAQGCDIETLMHRTAEEWTDLLGEARTPLFETVAGIDKSADRAGSRIWCALEALRKATETNGDDLQYDERIEDCLVFKGGGLTILTFPVQLLRGPGRMVAVVAANAELTEEENISEAGGDMGMFAGRAQKGQKILSFQFPLVLKDSSTVSGGVYFASYFNWLGKLRETALKPIGKYIADEFHNGHFMVTNFTETEISGRIGNHETVDARVWIEKAFGSLLILSFDWGKIAPDGTMKRMASSRQEVSWIRVVDHGIVEPVPSPEFFTDFLRDENLLPKEVSADKHDEPAYGINAYDGGSGKLLYEADILGEDKGILEESVINTTMEHSNLAQNIYFANYFRWQGHLRDRYLFNLSPEKYRKMDRQGQFACIHSSIKHLREAMPFDRVSVTMKLIRVYECGMDLYFEYFKIDNYGRKEKLAYGIHTLAWVRVNDSDYYVPEKLPSIYLDNILNAEAT